MHEGIKYCAQEGVCQQWLIMLLLWFFIFIYIVLDSRNAADNFVFQEETDHSELNELVAINVHIKSMPCGLVLTQELHETNLIELLNESIF